MKLPPMADAATSRPEGSPEHPAAPRLPGVRFRPFRDDADYERLAELIVRTHRHDGIPWLPTGDNLRTEMDGSTAIDPRRDMLFAELDGQLIGATSVERVVRDGVPVYDMLGNVLAEFRRHGLASALLDWTIRRIRQRAAAEDSETEVEIGGGAEEHETGHRALLEAAGFRPVRHFLLMRRATLDDAPSSALPEGLELRQVTPDQHRAILDAEFEAFRDHWGSREPTEDSYRITLSRTELDTRLWVVAWDGDQIAGVVENWIWTDENEKLGMRRGWLERISVRRRWRRRGLGRAITTASLVRLREAGMDEAMLGVDSDNPNGALGLYEGLGFAVHSRSAAYRRPLER